MTGSRPNINPFMVSTNFFVKETIDNKEASHNSKRPVGVLLDLGKHLQGGKYDKFDIEKCAFNFEVRIKPRINENTFP